MQTLFFAMRVLTIVVTGFAGNGKQRASETLEMETGRADFSYAVTLSVREGFPIWFRSKSLENEGGAISIVEHITYLSIS